MAGSKVTIRGIPEALWRRVKAHCAERGVTISAFVIEALTAHMEVKETA